ncbi:hypothetical protein ACFQX7_33500 [Luedemannella flava]
MADPDGGGPADATATHVVCILCHLVTDAAGSLAMMADLANLDPTTGGATAPVTATQPLDLARWQQTPAGQRRHASSLRYWEEQLRGVPSYSFSRPAERHHPRHWEGQLTSPALFLATHALARQLDVSSSHLILAAYASMLVRLRESTRSSSDRSSATGSGPGSRTSSARSTRLACASSPSDKPASTSWRGAPAGWRCAPSRPPTTTRNRWTNSGPSSRRTVGRTSTSTAS